MPDEIETHEDSSKEYIRTGPGRAGAHFNRWSIRPDRRFHTGPANETIPTATDCHVVVGWKSVGRRRCTVLAGSDISDIRSNHGQLDQLGGFSYGPRISYRNLIARRQSGCDRWPNGEPASGEY